MPDIASTYKLCASLQANYHLLSPHHSTPAYPTRSGVLCACVGILKASTCTGISVFLRCPWLVPRTNSVGSHSMPAYGWKTRPKPTSFPGNLWASPSVAFPSCSYKATRRVRRCVRHPLLVFLPFLNIDAQSC